MGKYPIVFVVWEDAFSVDAWTSDTEIVEDKLICIHSVGFLIIKNKNKITLSLNHDLDSDTLSCVINIPRKMVKSIKFLKTPKSKIQKKGSKKG